MKTINEKCEDINTVGSFCGCIAEGVRVDPAAKAFCKRAKTDKNVTGEDLAELKKALADLEDDDDCCGC
jgi:hypothetical protein